MSCATVSGLTAGVIAKLVVYPLDVLKKRRQIKGAENIREHFGKVIIFYNILFILKLFYEIKFFCIKLNVLVIW